MASNLETTGWGARMGRLEAETGGEVSAGSSIAAAFARDPFRNPPPCLTRPDLACLDDCEHGRAGPCARSRANAR